MVVYYQPMYVWCDPEYGFEWLYFLGDKSVRYQLRSMGLLLLIGQRSLGHSIWQLLLSTVLWPLWWISQQMVCILLKWVYEIELTVSSSTRKSFRSIFFVMTLDVSGWAIGITLLHIITTIDITGISVSSTHTTRIAHQMRYDSSCAMDAVSLSIQPSVRNQWYIIRPGNRQKSFLIISLFSNDYRQAFRAVFSQLSGSKTGSKSTVASTTNAVTVVWIEDCGRNPLNFISQLRV